MKKLKLNHEAAQKVLQGTLTSTWRLYDDKDLRVGDEVVILDKVDEANSATWRMIGTGHIERVLERRLGELVHDEPHHLRHDKRQDLLAEFRSYYGDRVTLDTPVKVIDFSFTPGLPDEDGPHHAARGYHGRRVLLYADGGSRGNPGPSACGYVIMDEHKRVMVDKGVYLGITTNNQAEYQGLKFGLEEVRAMGATEVDVRLDSMLVVNQMKGIFKVKNRDLWPVHDAAKRLAASFRKITFTHVPREMNKLADAAANRAMDDVAADRKVVAADDSDAVAP